MPSITSLFLFIYLFVFLRLLAKAITLSPVVLLLCRNNPLPSWASGSAEDWQRSDVLFRPQK